MIRATALILALAATPASACQMATLFELTYQSERVKDYKINTISREVEGSACIAMQTQVRQQESIQGGRDQFIVHVECAPCATVQADRAAYARKIEQMRLNAHKLMSDILK